MLSLPQAVYGLWNQKGLSLAQHWPGVLSHQPLLTCWVLGNPLPVDCCDSRTSWFWSPNKLLLQWMIVTPNCGTLAVSLAQLLCQTSQKPNIIRVGLISASPVDLCNLSKPVPAQFHSGHGWEVVTDTEFLFDLCSTLKVWISDMFLCDALCSRSLRPTFFQLTTLGFSNKDRKLLFLR